MDDTISLGTARYHVVATILVDSRETETTKSVSRYLAIVRLHVILYHVLGTARYHVVATILVDSRETETTKSVSRYLAIVRLHVILYHVLGTARYHVVATILVDSRETETTKSVSRYLAIVRLHWTQETETTKSVSRYLAIVRLHVILYHVLGTARYHVVATILVDSRETETTKSVSRYLAIVRLHVILYHVSGTARYHVVATILVDSRETETTKSVSRYLAIVRLHVILYHVLGTARYHVVATILVDSRETETTKSVSRYLAIVRLHVILYHVLGTARYHVVATILVDSRETETTKSVSRYLAIVRLHVILYHVLGTARYHVVATILVDSRETETTKSVSRYLAIVRLHVILYHVLGTARYHVVATILVDSRETETTKSVSRYLAIVRLHVILYHVLGTARYHVVATILVDSRETETTKSVSRYLAIVRLHVILYHVLKLHTIVFILNTDTDKRVYLMSPAVAQAIKCSEDFGEFLVPLIEQNTDYVFIPINDCMNLTNADLGSHWSLLLYVSSYHKFFYFDSSMSKTYNLSHAKKVAAKIRNHLNSKEPLSVEIVEVPMQTTPNDCGVHLLLYTDVLINKIKISSFDINTEQLSQQLAGIKPCDIKTKRAQLAYMLYNSKDMLADSQMVADMMHKGCFENHQLKKFTQFEDCFPGVKRNPKKRRDCSLPDGSKKVQIKVDLFADSQGKGLPEIVGRCSKGLIYMDGLVKSGANFEQIYNQASISLNRPLILLAGTNDMKSKRPEPIYKKMEHMLKSLSESRPSSVARNFVRGGSETGGSGGHQNRASLKRIIDSTIFCGENEILLRGHWATDDGRKPFRKEGRFSSVARVQIKLTVGKSTGKTLLIRSSATLDFTDWGIYE
ncbi:SUMO1 sentrin specific peptidase 8 [Homalodisca vitripennis]|nr:SUMO1 sentrin specific peptidase 8 [Homalodisca vitripennis]